MPKIDWYRIGTYVAGGALIVVGGMVPGAQPAIGAGVGLVALAKAWPGDKKKIRQLQEEIAKRAAADAAAAAARELERRAGPKQ